MLNFNQCISGCIFSVIFVLTSSVVAADAQAVLQRQKVVPIDTCARVVDADASSCAQDAMMKGNWPAFFKWAQIAVTKGDATAADWLAEEYNLGEDGYFRPDPIYTYMWFDIAARMRGQAVRQMPPTDNTMFQMDNASDIASRDLTAKELSPSQIAEALHREKRWLSTHKIEKNSN